MPHQLKSLSWKRAVRSEAKRGEGKFRQALGLLEPLISRQGRKAPWLYLLRYRLKRALSLPGAVRDVDVALRLDRGCAWIFGMEPAPTGMDPEILTIQESARSFSEENESSYLYAYRGRDRFLEGRSDEGLADLRKAAAMEPAGWIWAWLGEAERKAGRIAPAIENLTQALRHDPRYANAYAWRGIAFLQQGDLVRAKSDLDRAIRMRATLRDSINAPIQTARAYLSRARVHWLAGDHRASLNDLHRAVKLNSELSWGLPTPEGLKKTVEELDAAILKNPKEGLFDAWKGEGLLRLGRPEEALRSLDAALRKRRFAWAFTWRAQARLMLMGEGPDVKVSQDLKNSLKLDRGYALTHWLLAESQAREGRPKEALESMRRAIKLSPYSARLYLSRARVWLQLNARAKALKDIDHSLRLCSDFKDAENLRAEVLGQAPKPALKSLEFFVNYACNAKCPFCFNPPDASAELERGLPFEELARRMYSGYGQGYRAIKFIGGEVTIREDLPKILGLARRIGYRSIQVTTNGIRLAEPGYARRLVDLGVDSFRFSIHGHTPELHDRLVAVPGALDKIQRAVATLKPLGVKLGINYVLNRLNYNSLPETCRYFFGELGIPDTIIYFLRYQGFGALPGNKELLEIKMADAVPYVREAFRVLCQDGHRRMPTLIHFPPCAMPDLQAHMLDWTRDPAGCGEGNATEDRMTLPDGSGGAIHEVTNSGKRAIAACGDCLYSDRCLGVEANYLELFGDAEFAAIRETALTGR